MLIRCSEYQEHFEMHAASAFIQSLNFVPQCELCNTGGTKPKLELVGYDQLISISKIKEIDKFECSVCDRQLKDEPVHHCKECNSYNLCMKCYQTQQLQSYQ